MSCGGVTGGVEGEGARIVGNPGIKGTGSLRSREVENRIPKMERTERNTCRKQFCNTAYFAIKIAQGLGPL